MCPFVCMHALYLKLHNLIKFYVEVCTNGGQGYLTSVHIGPPSLILYMKLKGNLKIILQKYSLLKKWCTK
jgi:hypothetical protein